MIEINKKLRNAAKKNLTFEEQDYFLKNSSTKLMKTFDQASYLSFQNMFEFNPTFKKNFHDKFQDFL